MAEAMDRHGAGPQIPTAIKEVFLSHALPLYLIARKQTVAGRGSRSDEIRVYNDIRRRRSSDSCIL